MERQSTYSDMNEWAEANHTTRYPPVNNPDVFRSYDGPLSAGAQRSYPSGEYRRRAGGPWGFITDTQSHGLNRMLSIDGVTKGPDVGAGAADALWHSEDYTPMSITMQPKILDRSVGSRVDHLATKIAPRERQGRQGGSWRNVNEVLVQGGSQLVYIDGRVSLYDSMKGERDRLQEQFANTPRAAQARELKGSRYDWSSPQQRTVQHSYEQTTKDDGGKYNGFYALKRDNTVM